MICFWDEFRTTDDQIRSTSVNHNSGRSVGWRNGDLKSQPSAGVCWSVLLQSAALGLSGNPEWLTLSLPQHPSRNFYNHLSDYNTGRSLSSTLALECSLSLKTSCPKIVMGPLDWTNVPSLNPVSRKSTAQSVSHAVHPLRSRQLFCSVVWNIAWFSEGPRLSPSHRRTRANLMKLRWQNSAPYFGPAKRLCMHLPTSMNTACHISCSKTGRRLIYRSLKGSYYVTNRGVLLGGSLCLEKGEKDMDHRVNEK
jgi:hypothetical protein